MAVLKNLSITCSNQQDQLNLMKLLVANGFKHEIDGTNGPIVNINSENGFTIDRESYYKANINSKQVLSFLEAFNNTVIAIKLNEIKVYKVNQSHLNNDFLIVPNGTAIVSYYDSGTEITYAFFNKKGERFLPSGEWGSSNLNAIDYYQFVRNTIWTDDKELDLYEPKVQDNHQEKQHFSNQDIIKHIENVAKTVIQHHPGIPIHFKYLAQNGEVLAETLREYFKKK